MKEMPPQGEEVLLGWYRKKKPTRRNGKQQGFSSFNPTVAFGAPFLA